ncbi:SIR2 family protein [Alkalihalobacillus hemicellulosilyticus]|uniref:SIR2 family protein n=1 Tax=Halalkalibacter hemicellulosilyticus TaxID=127886 RepID=UPI0005556340|nr:SIR2 family protein [Halalkalibacter hemicellulosilyticus]
MYIEQLSREYHNDNLVLFLGAGASRKAGIATWDALISELFVALINQEMNKKGIKLTNSDKKSIVNSIQNQNGYSPLLQTRFLRQGFEEEFTDLVRDILYKDAVDTSHLLEELGQLCVPNRGMTGIKAIINYNFDDLIEKNLDRLRVKYHSVYSDGVKINSDELGIYHVHGFLPQNKEEYEDLSKSLLVFSEEGYHKLLLEPYNWANMTQLNYLTNDVCLFIGLSMTDPNLRRLLDIASQKNVEENPNHYAILKRFTITSDNNVGDDIMTFNHVNEELQESFFKELGINIIWVESFDDIPLILNRIKR